LTSAPLCGNIPEPAPASPASTAVFASLASRAVPASAASDDPASSAAAVAALRDRRCLRTRTPTQAAITTAATIAAYSEYLVTSL
jgi:hypothetical protein